LSWATIRRTPEYAKGRKLNVIAVSVMAVISFGMYLVFGVSVNLLKGILLTDAVLFASVSDFRIRRVPDWVSIVVAALGLVSVSGGKLLWNAVAGAIAFGFFFLAAVISKNKIGGADVKYIAASMFVCGFPEGLAGLILGLLLSVVGTLIRNKKTKSKDKTMPMIPYLSVGFLTAFMIGGI
jgi:leader peptidase (prepilin peptidase)/N-methyltransferase